MLAVCLTVLVGCDTKSAAVVQQQQIADLSGRLTAAEVVITSRTKKFDELLAAAEEQKQLIVGNGEVIRANERLLKTNEALLALLKAKLEAIPATK